MKYKVFGGNILCCFAETQKELALTFYRVQEFYESRYENLNRKSFNMFDFIDTFMDDDGNIHYFNEWDGFNIPKSVYTDWFCGLINNDMFDPNMYEGALTNAIRDNISNRNDDFYIIGVLENGDYQTLLHELSHALYYLNESYRLESNKILNENYSRYGEDLSKFRDELISHGYSDDVLPDEMIAYLATWSDSDSENYITDIKGLVELRSKFKNLLDSYIKDFDMGLENSVVEDVTKDREVLSILQEECAEVIQSISKCYRFGFDSLHNGVKNRDAMAEELGDLSCMIDILVERGVVKKQQIDEFSMKKREKLLRWSGVFN
jgi:NTP pyrophosphatase (non-canonical NTP hydrolase)